MANVNQGRACCPKAHSKKRRWSGQKINPVRKEQDDHEHTHHPLFRAGELNEPESPRTRRQNRNGVNIEDDHCAETDEDQRVPAEGTDKITVKKPNR